MIWVVLVAVCAVELWLTWRAWKAAAEDPAPKLDLLHERHAADLRARADRGRGPDWPRYREEIDRVFSTVDEQLRVWAAAVLAAGMGGTIASLMVHFLDGVDGTSGDIGPLLDSLPLALVGSLLGVVAHLVVVVVLLPRYERLFRQRSDEVWERLQQLSARARPAEPWTRSIERLPEVLGSLLEASISRALLDLPRVVSSLSGQVAELGRITQAQGLELGKSFAAVQHSARSMTEAARQLAPGIDRLSRFFERLDHFPAHLATVLAAERGAWQTDLAGQHEHRWQQLLDLLQEMESSARRRDRELLDGVASINAASAGVATGISDQVDDLARRLGDRFGAQAHAHVLEMGRQLTVEREKLFDRIDGHEQLWRNNIGQVVRQVQEEATRPIRDELVPELSTLGGSLRDVTEVMERVATTLEASHTEWNRSQQDALQGWSEAGHEIAAAAKTFGEGDHQLERAVSLLSQRAEGLESLIQQQEEFSDRLLAALEQVTRRHLEGWEPLRRETAKLVEALSHERVEHRQVLRRLGQTLENLLRDAVGAPARSMPDVAAVDEVEPLVDA